MPQCHKVHNWREYNATLQKRGDIFFFMKEEDTAKLPGNTQYDDACIMMTHHIKYTFQIRDHCIKNHHESIVVAIDRIGKHYNISDWHRKMTAKERPLLKSPYHDRFKQKANHRCESYARLPKRYRGLQRGARIYWKHSRESAYCTKTIHRTCYKNDIERILISPSRTHFIDETGGTALTQYLEDIRRKPLWNDDGKKPQDII